MNPHLASIYLFIEQQYSSKSDFCALHCINAKHTHWYYWFKLLILIGALIRKHNLHDLLWFRKLKLSFSNSLSLFIFAFYSFAKSKKLIVGWCNYWEVAVIIMKIFFFDFILKELNFRTFFYRLKCGFIYCYWDRISRSKKFNQSNFLMSHWQWPSAMTNSFIDS